MPIRIMPGEVTPTLFVGLGGSGGQAVGRIARRLRASADYELRYKSLVRFVAIDTNAADLARLRTGYGRVGHVDTTISIADFDKVEYAKLRRGESFAEADPYFMQWVHPTYRFREETGAGAGQIRIESRLGFFRSIEVGKLTRDLQDIIAALRSHEHGMRRHGAPIQAFVYFSIAGGTGSGAFLPFAYLLRDLLEDKRAKLYGFMILPDAFEEVVGMNREGTLANGYAALKELEHVNRLDTQGDDVEDRITLHYDPRNRHVTTVERRPYDLVYLVDRPADFTVDNVGAALADATYVQIFSPILGDQLADYDNYTKESRALFPAELGSQGYTAFYGTLGASVLLLPRRDLLDYAARRYAATAVRRYLLLDDPALVPPAERDRFKQFAVDREELETLSPDARADRLDRSFQQKIDLLAERDREQGVWKRVLTVRETAATRIEGALQSAEEELRGIAAAVREISADRILDDAWTPATTINTLAREVADAKAGIDARLSALLAPIESGDFFAELLAKAGPDAAPELSPYEQRYVLIRFRQEGGPLAASRTDEVARTIARLRTEADLGRESRFRSEMDAHAAELKRTYGGMDKLLTRKDKDFDAARDRTVATFNELVDKSRALLVKGALYELLGALGRAADALRTRFPNCPRSAARLALELEEKARRFEYDGGPDAETNDFLLDVEALQHPAARQRFWSFFYEDQVMSRPELTDEKVILGAVRESLRPRFDERGRPRMRTAREIVSDVEKTLIDAAKSFLGKSILGDPDADDPMEKAGLRMDQALALEARYYGLSQEQRPLEKLAKMSPLDPGALWAEEDVRRYIRRKLEAGLAKAQPLTRFNPETKSMINHADMLLVGIHASVLTSPIGEMLAEATYGKSADHIEDWEDPDRVVFYHSILGVPVYCFPHVNADMKSAYRRFQAKAQKAWPLHIEKDWELLPDVDPDDRRREIATRSEKRRVAVGAAALGCARALLAREADGWKLSVESGAKLSLGADLLTCIDALLGLEQDKPTVYDLAVAPLVKDAAVIADRTALKAEADTALRAWSARAMELEVLDKRDAEQEAEHRALREAIRVLRSITG